MPAAVDYDADRQLSIAERFRGRDTDSLSDVVAASVDELIADGM
ncbi:hypothetical protein [Natronorubrum halophilum]|nr:hypothetical protein [Natronorubrum halophilum]